MTPISKITLSSKLKKSLLPVNSQQFVCSFPAQNLQDQDNLLFEYEIKDETQTEVAREQDAEENTQKKSKFTRVASKMNNQDFMIFTPL